MICKKCGKYNSEGSLICRYCGSRELMSGGRPYEQNEVSYVSSKTGIGFVLGFFFGIIGWIIALVSYPYKTKERKTCLDGFIIGIIINVIISVIVTLIWGNMLIALLLGGLKA